ncbi:MAG: hypothetical protein K0U40_05945 [Betaproteobacteria bacterium]|nr:hypothetical protein [Betaproteobacteria bacterium]
MAISTEDQTKLLKIVTGLFNAAPGTVFLPDLESFIENGGTQQALARELAVTTIFTDTLSGATTSAEQAAILAGNFGLTADDVAGSAATQAIDFFTAGIDAGTNIGDLVYEAVMFLSDSPPAEFAEIAQLLDNKAAVSAEYSATVGSSDLSILQAALSTVTGTAPLTPEEITEIVDNAEGERDTNFTLTATADSVNEGGALVYTVTASEAVTADTDVVFSVVAGDNAAADQGTDTTNLNDFVTGTFNPVTVTIPAGGTTATFSVTGSDDGVTELAETYSVEAVVGGSTLTKTTTLLDSEDVPATVLTTGADNLPGSSGVDVFNGFVGNPATTSTMTGADTIGGAGGIDTFNITNASGAGLVNTNGALVSGIEIFNLRGSAAADTFAFDASGVAGATEINAFQSLGALTATNVPSGASIGVVGNGSITNAATTATYVAGATAPVLNISGGTLGAGAIGLTAAGATSLTINGTGAANTVGAISTASTGILATTINAATSLSTGGLAIGTNAAAQSLTISGAATTVAATATSAYTPAVVLGALDTDFASIDASGLTAGGVGATLSATVAATFTGGAGDDMVTTSTSGQTGAVNAGDGNDTLILAAAGHIDTTAEGALYAGFEVLSSAAAAIDMDLITGSTITAIKVGAAGSNVTDMNATQAGAVTIQGALGATTLGIKDATMVGTADTLALTISDGDTTADEAIVVAGDLTLAGIETVTINAVDGGAFTDMSNITGMTSLTVTGSAPVQFTTLAHVLESNVSIDFSGLTGASTFNAAGATTNAFAFTGGTAVDTVTDNVIGGNVISTGDGNDVITLTAKTGGTATTTITGGAGADATTTSIIGNGANDLMKFNYAAGDSVSDSSATGISATLTDTIAGLDGATLAAAAGASVEFDTEVAGTAVTVGASLVAQNVALGTTTVTNAGDFYVDITSATTANIYQDTDGDGIIEAGEFAVGLTGVATDTLLAADFTVVGGDLILITT